MKITFVLKTIPRTISGGVLVIFKYANYLSEKGYNVELLIIDSPMWSRTHLPECVRRLFIKKSVQRRPSWFQLNKDIIKYCVFNNDLLRVHNADIVIATSVDTAKDVAAMLSNKGKKYYFIQDFENWVVSDQEVQETYSLGMVNITVSNWLSSIVDKHSNARSFCVPNGIDTSVFKEETLLAERFKHSIVFHYRSNRAKGCNYAIEVCKRIKELYPDTVIRVISNEVKPDNIPDYFQYYYNISQERVAQINNETSIFICSTIDEGFGLPGLEAMACGCALVSTCYKGVLEYAIDGVNALLSPVKDVNAMLDNIVRLYENDELRNRLTQNGIKTGKEKSFLKAATEFEKVLIQVNESTNYLC